MVAYVLYTKATPSEREVRHLVAELAQLQVAAELVEADGQRGIAMAELYDLTARPAVVVAESDGTLIQSWQGQLPPATEISYAVHQ